ncbi:MULTISPECIES: Fe2+-enterobactin ABC transporter substrate-binding protein [Pseudomonas]|uniref:Fe2+-enterobactin ABC transporter substrate-binding protein n=1 Tax=Pseudomonas oryzihabitans TaxID=47885 RepID=A0A178LCU8_9PSED|nr:MULTISPECIES: Fe2+-enterobactin ABC transporter substrate-binding protein [Pseudomonas]NRH43094.1 Fe2+-enterobactin ABC transporter substrate-binding protein [Pseudomonas sp. MS15a(2019)]OAN28202.1 Fe2+-enterobactin ABC transporter substrate-binding protein [Pseudomonas oryzihabitans]UUW72434.1 Fe2+-enterobactin ABC transporter substrate-binding protein [Pseudomonas psychrotolerans]SEO96963.1 iron complex transport system substrate-binding protein [Pseudomonas sp. Snoq117.2]
MFSSSSVFRILTPLILAILALGGTARAADWPRQISADGNQVTLPAKPQRIVSTSVTLTGALLAIGAPVVASGATSPNNRFADDQGFLRQWGQVAKQHEVKRLYIGEANAEAVAAEAPDLILVSAAGNDSALRLVDQLKAIAPVLVVGYDNRSWQQVVELLGQATGREDAAAKVVADFDRRVSDLKARLQLPPQPVSAFVYNPATRQANLWTAASSQGQLLESLGFTLATLPAGLTTGHSQGQRHDILQLAGENVATGLTGQTFLLFAADTKEAEAVRGNPLLAHLPAVKDNRVEALGAETFRLDPYSANLLLDRLEQRYAKP